MDAPRTRIARAYGPRFIFLRWERRWIGVARLSGDSRAVDRRSLRFFGAPIRTRKTGAFCERGASLVARARLED